MPSLGNVKFSWEVHLKSIPTLCLGLILLSALPSQCQTASAERPAYRHAYYLFLADPPKGCEDCYVPLLITTSPLEQAAKAATQERCVLIVTYERDSIWHNDGLITLASGDIEAAPRIVHLRDRRYRYQEITSSEILKLLQNPMGTIPISRPYIPNPAPPTPTLQDLISAFRDSK